MLPVRIHSGVMCEEKLDLGDRHAVYFALFRIGFIPIESVRASLYTPMLAYVYTNVHTINNELDTIALSP